MRRDRPINLKVYTRALVAIALIIVGGLAGFTGLLLWLAPSGPRSGWRILFLGLTKSQWGDIHFWISMIAVGVTLIHIIIDWRALRGCVRYMTSAHRRPEMFE